MFGKPQRGVSERPNKTAQPRVPKWLWTLFGILLLIFLITMLMLWRPWQPVVKSEAINKNSLSKETNQDFRFYDLLPEQQLTPIPQQAVPESADNQPSLVVADPDAAASELDDTGRANIEASEPNISYILQVRSYPDPDSADARRAEIVMNGLSADVIQTEENGKVWYRVISGPYESQAAALIAQQTLQNSGIDSIVVKKSN